MGTRRWLVLLLVAVAAINTAYGFAFPVPAHSSHDAFLLIPQFQKLLLGYAPMDSGLGMFHPTSFSGEAGTGGGSVFWGLIFENNRGRHWTQLPHPVALAAWVARWVPSTVAVQGVFTGYLLLTLAALHGIGTRLGGPRAGLLSAIVGAGCPGLFGFSRYLECHLPVACLSTVVVWLLLCTRGLRRWRWCFAVSLVSWSLTRSGEGAADLVAAGLVLLGPAAWVAYSGLRDAIQEGGGWGEEVRTWAIGFGLAVLPLVLLSDLSWIQGALIQIVTAFRDPPIQFDVLSANGGAGGELGFRLSYFILIFSDYLGVFLGLALIGSVFFLKDWDKSGRVLFLLWWFLPLLAFSWMQRKASWYAVVTVPPLALAIGIGLARHVAAARVVGGLALLQLLTASFIDADRWPSALGRLRQPVPLEDWRLRRVDLLRPSATPADRRLAGEIRNILDWMATEMPKNGQMRHIGLLTMGYQHDYAIRYLLAVERPDLEVVSVGDSRLRETDYQGLGADQIELWLFQDGGFRSWPPAASRLEWLRTDLQCQPGDPVDGFLAGILEQSWEQVVLSPSELTLYRRTASAGAGLEKRVLCGGE